jgi:CBS domain-containing protein
MPTALRDARTVEQAMSGQFAFCFPSTSLAQAARMMAQNRVYELPVIVDQRCLGYVSYLDILQRYVRAQLGARAADIVRTPLPEVRPDLPLSEAVRLLRESGRQVILVTTPAGMPVGGRRRPAGRQGRRLCRLVRTPRGTRGLRRRQRPG